MFQATWRDTNHLSPGIGHRDAYELAGILHRDISAGNLLIVPIDGQGDEGILYKGVLNDWELAERISRRTVPGFVYPTRRRVCRTDLPAGDIHVLTHHLRL